MNDTTGTNQATPGPVEKPPVRPPGRPRKETTGKRLVQVTAHLEPDTVEALDKEAALLQLPSRSDVIRRACLEYLRRQEKRRNRTGDDDG